MTPLDIIGDIHGHARPLRTLLEGMGYRRSRGRYWHPRRQAVFLGDFIDRGPEQREVLDIVRTMVERGAAHAVMGNHEFNALAYHTEHPHESGEYLRPRTSKNQDQHAAFMAEHQDEEVLAEALEWFWELPLWLDLGAIRVVHATWHPPSLHWLRARLSEARRLTPELLVAASQPHSDAYDAVEIILKGLEATLPAGVTYRDEGGHERRHARLKWWLDSRDASWHDIAFIPRSCAEQLPEARLPPTVSTGYPAAEPPVFVGHYWLKGLPTPQAPNVACVDYSVAKPGGKLVAYRWEGERRLSADRFVAVPSSAR
jgi:hypothetical protein